MRKKPRSYTPGDSWKSYREAKDLRFRIRRQMLQQQNRLASMRREQSRTTQSRERNPTGLSNLWRKFLQSDLVLDLRTETHRILTDTMTYLLIVIANVLGAWLLLQLVLFILT